MQKIIVNVDNLTKKKLIDETHRQKITITDWLKNIINKSCRTDEDFWGAEK